MRNLRGSLLAYALDSGLEKEEAWRLAAVADELVSNLEEHGNADWLQVSAELPHDHEPLRLRLLDNSHGFNLVLAAAVAEEPDGLRERGLGLFMVRQATRSLWQGHTSKGENETVLEF